MTIRHRDKPDRTDQSRYLKLLPYSEVREKIRNELSRLILPVQNIRVDLALGRVCTQVVRSNRDVPSRNISAMDGYAIMSSDTKSATLSEPVFFKVKGWIYPGTTKSRSKISRLETYYVATGSELPEGADAVARVEETRLMESKIAVSREIPSGKNISLKGEDIKSGQILLEKGCITNSADLTLLISAGVEKLGVYKVPDVGILSIGDELRKFGEVNGRIVNNYANLLHGYLSELGVRPRFLGISRDDSNQIRKIVRRQIERLDMIITLGGSSVGVKDLTLDALETKESITLFHGVRMAPIRPAGLVLMYDKPVVILPGHAVSAALSFFLIVIPALNVISGLQLGSRQSNVRAVATEEFSNSRPMDALFLVSLEEEAGSYRATPLGWGSNAMLNLAKANGFIHLNSNQLVGKGEEIPVTLLGNSEISRIRHV